MNGFTVLEQSAELDQLLPALLAAQAAFDPAVRNSDGQIQNRRIVYADLAECIGATRTQLAQHGLLTTSAISTPDATTARVRVAVMHTSGQFMACTMELQHAGTPQTLGSAVTYARRIGRKALLDIADVDDDAHSTSPPTPTHRPTESGQRGELLDQRAMQAAYNRLKGKDASVVTQVARLLGLNDRTSKGEIARVWVGVPPKDARRLAIEAALSGRGEQAPQGGIIRSTEPVYVNEAPEPELDLSDLPTDYEGGDDD